MRQPRAPSRDGTFEGIATNQPRLTAVSHDPDLRARIIRASWYCTVNTTWANYIDQSSHTIIVDDLEQAAADEPKSVN
jgi:hypothetical protein